MPTVARADQRLRVTNWRSGGAQNAEVAESPGRPSELTNAVAEKILVALRANVHLEVAANAAGVSFRTVQRWMKRGKQEHSGPYREFRAAVIQAQASAEIGCVASIAKSARTDWRASMALLERRYPKRWLKRRMKEEDSDQPSAEEMADQVRGFLKGAKASVPACPPPGSEPTGDAAPGPPPSP